MPHWLAQPYFRPLPASKPEPEPSTSTLWYLSVYRLTFVLRSEKSTAPAKRVHAETELTQSSADGEEAKRAKLDEIGVVEGFTRSAQT